MTVKIDCSVIEEVLDAEAEFFVDEDHFEGGNVKLTISLSNSTDLADSIADAIADTISEEQSKNDRSDEVINKLRFKMHDLETGALAKKESSYISDWLRAYADMSTAHAIKNILNELGV